MQAIPLTTIKRRVRLKPGQGRNLPVTFATPATLPDGNDYLLADISGGAGVVGNAFASPNSLAVKQSYVELVTEFVYLPGPAIQTNGIVASQPWAAVRVVNIGSTIARGIVNLSLYMSPSNVLDASAAMAARWKPFPVLLKPGQSRLFPARIALPYGSLPGSYTLFGVASPGRGITVRHPADLVAAGSRQVEVVSTVPTETLLANYRRHPRHCTFYDGSDYCADPLADFGFDEAVVQGDSIPPGFSPDFGPTTGPSSQPSSQPSSDAWDSGLQDAANDVTAEQISSGNGNTDSPGDAWGADVGDDHRSHAGKPQGQVHCGCVVDPSRTQGGWSAENRRGATRLS